MAAVLALAATQAMAYREGDSQLWLAAGAETGSGAESGPGQDIRIGIDLGARWGDSMSDYFYKSYEPYLVWKAAPWLDITFGDEFIQSKKGSEWLDEQVPKVTVQIKGDSGPLTLSNRSRMEYRLREEANDEWRYRDRVRLQLAKGVTSYKVRPFVDDELYFSCDEQQFNENRASAGFAAEVIPRVKVELYYLVRSQLNDDLWTDTNVVGLKLAFVF